MSGNNREGLCDKTFSIGLIKKSFQFYRLYSVLEKGAKLCEVGEFSILKMC